MRVAPAAGRAHVRDALSCGARYARAVPVRRILLVAALLAVTGVVAAPAPPAAAIHATATCGSYAGYKVKARNVGCRFARRWAIRSYNRRVKPAGWRCTYGSRRSSVRLFCYRGSKAYFLQR